MKELYDFFLTNDPDAYYPKYKELVNMYNQQTKSGLGFCTCRFHSTMKQIEKYLKGSGQI